MNRAIRLPALGLTLAVLMLHGGSALRAQDKDAPPEKGVTIEGITEYRLKNGCKFLLFPDRASSTVTVTECVPSPFAASDEIRTSSRLPALPVTA